MGKVTCPQCGRKLAIDQHVDAYLAAAEEIFPEVATAIKQDDIRQRIGGPIRHSGFARLT